MYIYDNLKMFLDLTVSFRASLRGGDPSFKAIKKQVFNRFLTQSSRVFNVVFIWGPVYVTLFQIEETEKQAWIVAYKRVPLCFHRPCCCSINVNNGLALNTFTVPFTYLSEMLILVHLG